MSKRNSRKYKISRRLGENLWGRAKDPVNNRNYPPGAHGMMGYKKLTDYATQLRAKQRLKKYYGDITEKQFRRVYAEAVRRKGDTGQNIIGLLESRLDAFVYRMCIVPTIFAARQFVNHKHVTVNDKVVNIPSYRLTPGDIVKLRSEATKSIPIVQESLASNEHSIPSYIQFDHGNVSATYSRIPVLQDVPFPVEMELGLIVAYYSR